MSFVIHNIRSAHDGHHHSHPRTFFRVIFAAWLGIGVLGFMIVLGFPFRTVANLFPCGIFRSCEAVAFQPQEAEETSNAYLASVIHGLSIDELSRGQMVVYLKDMLLDRGLIDQNYVLETLNMDIVEFADVERLHPAYPASKVLSRRGILKGKKYEEMVGVYLRPETTIRRGEMAALLVRGLELPIVIGEDAPHFKDAKPEQWFYRYVETLYSHGALQGVTEFKAANLATEGFLKNVLKSL